MITLNNMKKAFFIAMTASTLTACLGGDKNTELASLGETGENPGTGGSGGSGGSGGGGSVESCPTGTVEVALGTGAACQVSGTLTSDLTLTSGNTYVLNGKVTVGQETNSDGTGGTRAELTIEPGVTVAGLNANSFLVISRGSSIDASGSASQPIIFTSAAEILRGVNATPIALNEGNTAEWGGIVVNGLAPINGCASGICEAAAEGDAGNYGGADAADSSGTMRYVQVKYAGNIITDDDELNGIAFGGVGSGTTLDYIHVHNGADDGVEFFGGTANIKHLVITGADDDSLDWTKGWRGKAQHVLVMQNDNQPASDQGIEADNNGSDNDATPYAQPTLANVTLIGGNTQGDIGMLLREGTGAKIYNTVVAGFLDFCLDIDQASTYARRDGADGITIESTLLSCGTAFASDTEDGDLEAWFTGQPNNAVATSTLSSFFNGNTENTQTATDVNAIDAWFDVTDYIGAVKSNAAVDNWTLGWTYGINPNPVCPAGTTPNGAGGCIMEGVYTGNITLQSGLDYILRGKVVIGEDQGPDATAPLAGMDAGVLTIDAGVELQGEDANSFLVISRGSQILSNGTKDAPVVMTATNDAGRNLNTDTALWGGVVINGRATINGCAVGICEAAAEGDAGNYGGNDDDDDSGQLYYTVVKYAGNIITDDDELNGIAFGGVGRETEVDYVQVHNGADDGVEFFGGTVRVKHLVVTGSDDDSIDWTKGWRGAIQHAVVVQNDEQLASDQGIEADNNGSDNDAAPFAQPLLSNITLVGGDTNGDIGILLREGTGAKIINVVTEGFNDFCLDLDQASTYSRRDSATPGEGITITSTYLSCGTSYASDTEDGDLQTWFEGQDDNDTGVTTLSAPAGGSHAYINGTNENAVDATDPATLGTWFDATDYIGAVENSGSNWTEGWTVWLNE
ncbi:hypothetical protein [Pseudemcibacter aquimaris]|uniref:hypothetical protein n=1 Tax=Pseudemcibacter aquimaris TaxID=2857064 RepID=UPI002011B47A|nr:hypothetical protein [Pseudemcibacter aquimaris]MCC3861765.1 hypothetical protein [Pseudemcibacter aquimaris]WDU58531.1 hypothetical protein KW060_15185 [Pseudemcibacter aquimaris]